MGNLPKNTKWFKDKVYNYHGDKVEILSDYNGSDKPINIVYHCKKHGDTYKTLNAKNICKKYFLPCKECQSINKSKSAQANKKDKTFYYDRLVNYCKSKGGIVIEKEWTKAKDIYHFKCDNADHPIFSTTADALYSGEHWCPYCSGRKGNFQRYFEKIVENKNGELLNEYINANTHLKVRCKEHNYIWKVYPNNLKKGRWCPICNMYFNEKVVYDFFKNNKCKIVPQYYFEDFKLDTNDYYRYDFGILKNGKLFYLIEVDDEEHRDNHLGDSERQIERRKAQERDKIKDKYCLDNSINLFRMGVPFRNFQKEEWSYERYYSYIENQLSFILNELKISD